MKSFIGEVGRLIFGEGLSIYDGLDILGVGEYEGERDKTTRFLRLNGERVSVLEQIADRGDLIAVIDGWGGFVAFVTNGISKKHHSSKRRLYTQYLDGVVEGDGEVGLIKFSRPEWFYWARLDEKSEVPYKFPEDIRKGSEVWYRSRDIPAEAFKEVPKVLPRIPTMGWTIHSGDIRDDNIYRLTSPIVIERIKSNIQNIMNSPIFYYPYS